jgi:hypothetical protein
MAGGIYRETGAHGDYDVTQAVWKATLLINPGDMVFRDTADGYDKKASAFTWTTNLATTQPLFKAAFRGIAMARRIAAQLVDGGISDGNILESGEFVFPCAALGGPQLVGALVGPAKDTGNNLADQVVAIVATASLAIGVLTRAAATGDVFLYFKINPVLSIARGVQAVV